jgi:hypothetical protein
LDDAFKTASKISLPKVAISNEELAQKLGNTEAKWQVKHPNSCRGFQRHP